MNKVKVYGADWCHDTQNTIRHLAALGVPYDFLDVDGDAAAKAWVAEHNHGKQKLPTVDVGGQILSIPDNGALDRALRAQGIA